MHEKVWPYALKRDLGTHVRAILKWGLNKYGVRVRIGFKWLKTHL
jgi:hypothetical protein